MRINYLFVGLLSLMAVACTVEEIDRIDPRYAGDDEVFHAVIDEESSTRTFIDADLNILWNKKDRITLFNNVTVGAAYEFLGEDGEPSGDFKKIVIEEEGGDEIISGGTELGGDIYAVYPYSKDTKILQNGTITYTFPGVQTYYEKSFGLGANVMVAKTSQEDKILRFKNAMGYLCFRLYGDDVHVSSIIMKANGGEPIAGKGTIRDSENGPVVTMDESSSSDEIRLYCDDVLLGTSETDYTDFWFALPPVSLTKAKGGFTITVTTTDGGVFKKTAPIDLTIKRKTVERMLPLKVTPTYSSASNMGIKSLSSTRGSKTYNAVLEDDGTYTLTIPTVTDFSQLVVNYTLKKSSDILMVGGKEVDSGETPIDVSQKPTSLVVRRGDVEKTFKLTARNTGLPVVRIVTGDEKTGYKFTLAELERYENSLQSSDKKDHRIWLPEGDENFVSVTIERADGTEGMKLKGSPVHTVDTKVKGRGNYTWKWDKKPYALKFDKKTEVLDMPEHKRWVLLANWRDRTLMRNDVTFELSRRFGLPYTVRGQFVELEFNGEHRGNYYLCEQIKIDKNRVNIKSLDSDDFADLSGGYLMEIDSYWDEVNKFKSKYFTLKYMFKEPDKSPSDVDYDPRYQAGYEWMENYIKEFERVLKTRKSVADGDYEKYLDTESAIKFVLLNELSGNRDFFQNGDDTHYGPHSTYLYKDKGGKLFMGPGWDFDYETYIAQSYINDNSDDGWRGFLKTGYYYHYLRYNADFVEEIKSIWNQRKSAVSGLPSYISVMADRISLSQKFDAALWPYKGEANRNDNHDYYSGRYPYGTEILFSTAIQRMKDNFSARVTWIDDRINGNENAGIDPLGTTDPEFLFEDSSEWPIEE